MVRPRKFDENKVLAAVKNVFWENGYDGTSYADLIQASGLHKGSLYAAFGDKQALYLRALDHYHTEEVQAAIEILSGRGQTAGLHGQQRVIVLLQTVIDAAIINGDRRGCLLCNASMDQAPFDAAVEKSVNISMEAMQDAFTAALEDIVSGERLKEVAHAVCTFYVGLRLMVRSGSPVSSLQASLNGFKLLLNQPTAR